MDKTIKNSDKKLEDLNKGQEILIENQKALFEAIKRVAEVINDIQDHFVELAELTEKLVLQKEKREKVHYHAKDMPEMYV
ncbi:MAG: hypothetical protein ACFFA5_02620 [Promethearchaeota archaeon]